MALDTSAMTMDEISEVILVGGGTRVPKVQEILKEFLGGKKELGKNLNTDEAAAMGAVYKVMCCTGWCKISAVWPPIEKWHKSDPI